ncbi:MAG: hypothetical protein ACFCU1_09255 [Sumerlaeia bacterium]
MKSTHSKALQCAVFASFALLSTPFGTAVQAQSSNQEKALNPRISRVTTIAAFPRGIVPLGQELVILSRGRVRSSGGVSADVQDNAGTLYTINPNVRQNASEPNVSQEVRENGTPLALPTAPPFRLWDVTSTPPWDDRETDRPYCVVRFHEASQNFFICAFSGVDKPRSATTAGGRSFSKNLTDAILRYDLRNNTWFEVERHDIEAGGLYPHNDPAVSPPPHGWLNGPNNIHVQGNWLYGVGKDNSLLVRYNLAPLLQDSEAGALESEWILGSELPLTSGGSVLLEGHSALAWHNGYCYLGTRTNSVVVRFPMNEDGSIPQPMQGELIAKFDPYNHTTGKSADITDITFDDSGNLYVLNAEPSRVHRFVPNPQSIYDARNGAKTPWVNLAEILGTPRMKSENILFQSPNKLFITSGDGYTYQSGADGTLYVVEWD